MYSGGSKIFCEGGAQPYIIAKFSGKKHEIEKKSFRLQGRIPGVSSLDPPPLFDVNASLTPTENCC